MGMNVIGNYQCIIIKMHMEDASRDYLSFALLKHHAYYSRGFSWYWQDHIFMNYPFTKLSNVQCIYQKIQMTFIKYVAKVPTMVCFQHVRAILVIVYPHGGRRHQPKFEEPLTHSAVRAPSARLVACVRFMEVATHRKAPANSGNKAQNSEGELELITLDSNYETNCLNQFWLQQWWQLHMYIYSVYTMYSTTLWSCPSLEIPSQNAACFSHHKDALNLSRGSRHCLGQAGWTWFGLRRYFQATSFFFVAITCS